MPDEPVEETKPAVEPKGKAVVPASGAGRAVATPAAPAVVVVDAPLAGVQMPQVSRRKVLQIGFWGGIGGMLLGIAATTLNSLYPRGISGFGTTITVGNAKDLVPGVPRQNLEAKTWLVKFDADMARRNPGAQEGAVLALYQRCVHLGCTVPYRADFSFEDPRSGETYAGWFRCPCHGSTYTSAGVRVFGPAPRALDTFELTIDPDGTMKVNTGSITAGDNESNPSRAILPA